MFKFHSIIIYLLVLLASGCSRVKKKIVEKDEIQEEVMQNVQPLYDSKVKEKVLSIDKKWIKKCSVALKDSVDSASLLRKVATNIGCNLSIAKEIKLNYSAKNKAFIEILLDICAQVGLKIQIKDLNGMMLEDSPYFHTYYMSDLSSSMTTEFSTSVDHSFGSTDKMNMSKNSYKNQIDRFAALEKDLSSLIMKPNFYTVNRQSGVITVFAPQSIQRICVNYLNSIKKGSNDQVLVSATFFEVELIEEFSCGIDFESLSNALSNNIGIMQEKKQNRLLTFASNMSEAMLKNRIFVCLSTYGKTRSVSNPYLLISNNNVGIFKATENNISFRFKNETIIGSNQHLNTTSKHADFVSCPVGVTFSVHVLKLKNGLIKLYIKPTITEVSREIDDAGYQYATTDSKKILNNKEHIPKIPIIKTRELESVLILRDNQYAIIGGLIDQNTKNEKSLLKKTNSSKRTELIILLKVQSVENDDAIDVYEFLTED